MSQALANIHPKTHDKLASPMLLTVIALGFDAGLPRVQYELVTGGLDAGRRHRGTQAGVATCLVLASPAISPRAPGVGMLWPLQQTDDPSLPATNHK